MGELYDLSDICVKCGTGHLPTPCQGGKRCTCCCRKCGEPMRHASAPLLGSEGDGA